MIKTVQRPTVPPVVRQKQLEQDEVFVAPVPTVENSGEPNVGVKFDAGKPRFDLVSPEWEEGLARVMQHGAQKYADRNWEKGIDVGRCYAAFRRHVNAFLKGEDIDPESGLHHLFHANANLMFLWAMPLIHPERDDRCAIGIVTNPIHRSTTE